MQRGERSPAATRLTEALEVAHAELAVAMRMTGHNTPSVFPALYNIVSDEDLRETILS